VQEVKLSDQLGAMAIIDELYQAQQLLLEHLDRDKLRNSLTEKIKNYYQAKGLIIDDKTINDGVNLWFDNRLRFISVRILSKLAIAMSAVEGFESEDQIERARLELARDVALRDVQKEDGRYQIVLDLSNNLIVSYNSAEAVFARLQQTTSVKERVYQQSVSFFSTNEIVFTALSASITSLTGLHESTKTLEAMKDGINKGLESISTSGSKQLEEGLRAGYGSTIKAESLRTLMEAIINYQESSHKLIAELRNESISNAQEIDRIVEDGKQRFNNIILKASV